MSILPKLTDDELYLIALMDDPAGIDLAEFCFIDETPGKPDPCYRVWDYQWPWYQCEETYQIDQAGRSLGKSQGIIMRAHAFPFNFPGQEMLITAPELNHLDPLTTKIEEKFLHGSRLSRAMLPRQKGGGIKHQPQFQATFVNGAKIMGRLPNRDGRGVKGCLAAGGLVLTRRGQVPIEEVAVGDEVLTHLGRWKPVVHIVRDTAPCVEVAGGGHRGLVMSDNHRMAVRRNLTPQKAKTLGVQTWATPDDLEHAHFGSPTRFPAEPVPAIFDSEAMMVVVGRYVADGYLHFQTKSGRRTRGRLHVITDARREKVVRLWMKQAGLRPSSRQRTHNGTFDVEVSDTALCRAILEHFGQHADGKVVPTWLLGANERLRAAFLTGYLAGDGHHDASKGRWVAGSASKALAVGVRLIGQSLGRSGSYSWVDPKVSQVAGQALKAVPMRSHRVTLGSPSRAFEVERGVQWAAVRKVSEVGEREVFDLVVQDDNSFIVDGLISHNQHPLVLEHDEGQDYPRQGWIELIETMKAGIPGAQWRVHGVSRGVRDMYYRMTSKNADIPFYVHRYMAMHRPTWSAEERKEKIAIYGGSRDNPDYKRNIYGEHGDVTNPVFVLARLMATVRMNESTWATEYNENVYNKIKIEGESLENRPIESFLTFPRTHLLKDYTSFWAGMDIGFTEHPSELLVFGMIRQRIAGVDLDVLRLLSRIHLMRISAPDQERVIEKVFDFYGDRLKAIALDKTGAGLPIWQHMDTRPDIRARVKGYGFSQKKAVALDDREPEGKERPEDVVIEKNIIDFATDKLRERVDSKMIELPYDQELLTEFQGQTVVYTRDEGSSAGRARQKFGGGSFHTLDAAKLAVLGLELEAMEELERARKQYGPVLDQFGLDF